MENKITPNFLVDVYKKTFAYEMESVKINEDGSTTHLHSDAFLEKHPERRDTPEFTEEEELEQIMYIAELAEKI